MFNRTTAGPRPASRPLATEEPLIAQGAPPASPPIATGPEPLSADETAMLERLEKIIRVGLTHFRELGNCLEAIKVGRLYRQHGSWDDYLRARWGLSETMARRLIQAAELCRSLEGAGLPPVRNENQARALNRVPEEHRVEAWKEIVETVPPEARTAELIAEKVKRHVKRRGRHKRPAAIKLRGPGWRIQIERTTASVNPTAALQQAVLQLAEREASSRRAA